MFFCFAGTESYGKSHPLCPIALKRPVVPFLDLMRSQPNKIDN